jgi:hypothetical protein
MKNCIRLSGGALVSPDGGVFFPQVADWWAVKAHDLGGGHLEVSAKRPRYYLEGVEEDLTQAQAAQLRRIRRDGVPEPTAAELEARKALSAKISGNRRKSAVRKHCKSMNADSLLTLTFRENVTDIQVCKSVLRAFVRRIKVVCPAFRGVAVFERQARGAWHVHLATTRHALTVTDSRSAHLKSYNVIRAVWRSAAGELGGNIDVSSRKRNSKRSPAKLASYLSKYLTKDSCDGVENVNMWTKFGDIHINDSVSLGNVGHALDMLKLSFDLGLDGQSVSSMVYSKFGDWFFLAFESVASGRLLSSG